MSGRFCRRGRNQPNQLDGAADDERRMILSGAPIPQRLVVQMFARRSLAAYRRRLHGVAS
jgi:hypothetical protein